jgi:hypothetical protein
MHDPWSQITRRIDRIACRPSEGQADRQHQQPHRQGIQRTEAIGRRRDEQYPPDQDKCADDLGQQVISQAADGRTGAEHRQFGAGILLLLKMLPVRDPAEQRAGHGPQHLCGDIHRHFGPGELTHYGKG